MEAKVIGGLENKNVEYEYETRTYSFDFPVRRGRCADCGGNRVVVRRHYTPDIFLKNGVVVEIKGKLTGELRSLYKAFIESPEGRGVDLRFLFQRDNWITKKHKSRYSDWADKLGVKYHVGEAIPDEWLV